MQFTYYTFGQCAKHCNKNLVFNNLTTFLIDIDSSFGDNNNIAASIIVSGGPCARMRDEQ